MNHFRWTLVWFLVVVVGVAIGSVCCSIWPNYRQCDEIDATLMAELPERLSETGLFEDFSSRQTPEGVFHFTPNHELWSDGAGKERWAYLPAGSQIDSSDMDFWSFPPGSKFWKEFRRDGKLLETRLFYKSGPHRSDWVGAAYLWDDDESDAFLTPDGASTARGVDHIVPSAAECAACHGGVKSHILGFSAVQLPFDDVDAPMTLKELEDQEMLSDPPEGPFVIPGDPMTQNALGYLHANCAHCHNQHRPPTEGERCYDPQNQLDFFLTTDSLGSPQATATYQSAVGSSIEAGRPGSSQVVELMSTRRHFYMPPLATSKIDDEAVEAISAWIEAME